MTDTLSPLSPLSVMSIIADNGDDVEAIAAAFDPTGTHAWAWAFPDPTVRERWRERFDNALEARSWCDAFPQPLRGDAAGIAANWRFAGFTPDTAHRWLSNGVTVPGHPRQWDDHHVDPVTAGAWSAAGFLPPEKAFPWIDLGFAPTTASVWAAESIPPGAAHLWAELGIPADLAGRYADGGVDVAMYHRWKNAGCDNEQIADWRDLAASVTQAVAWTKAALTPGDARRWLTAGVRTLAGVRRFTAAGYTADQVRDWWVGCYEKEPAGTFRRRRSDHQHLDVHAIQSAEQAGLTPRTVRLWQHLFEYPHPLAEIAGIAEHLTLEQATVLSAAGVLPLEHLLHNTGYRTLPERLDELLSIYARFTGEPDPQPGVHHLVALNREPSSHLITVLWGPGFQRGRWVAVTSPRRRDVPWHRGTMSSGSTTTWLRVIGVNDPVRVIDGLVPGPAHTFPDRVLTAARAGWLAPQNIALACPYLHWNDTPRDEVKLGS